MWLRIDDVFPEHPKIIGLTDKAFRMHLTGMCYAARYQTDGSVPKGIASRWGTATVRELVSAGLWEAVGDAYEIHDYLDYNPSRVEIDRVSQKKAKAGRKGGRRSGEARRSKVEATAKQTASKDEPVLVLPPQPLSFDKSAAGPRPETNGKPKTPNEIQKYLLQKLVDRDPRWDELWGLLTKLNAQMTRPIVTTALQHLVESDAPAERPPALLVDTCKRIQEEQTA